MFRKQGRLCLEIATFMLYLRRPFIKFIPRLCSWIQNRSTYCGSAGKPSNTKHSSEEEEEEGPTQMYIHDEMGRWCQRNLLSGNGEVKSCLFFIRERGCAFSRKWKGSQLSRVISSTDTFGFTENGHHRILPKMG